MKSILELFAQDEIKVNTRHYNHVRNIQTNTKNWKNQKTAYQKNYVMKAKNYFKNTKI